MEIGSYLRFVFHKIIGAGRLDTQRVMSVFEIDYQKLRERGIGAIIFDVDDTLSGERDVLTSDALDLLKRLSNEFKIALLSNCTKKRCRDLIRSTKKLDIVVLGSSDKPSKRGFLKVMRDLNTKPERTVMIGDRAGIDIWGAYTVGIKERILVKPHSDVFSSKKPSGVIRFLRRMEK